MLYKKMCSRFLNFDKLENYVQIIEKKNKFLNLTSFTQDTLWKEGIYESVKSLEIIKAGKLLDIGAGVGFPSIPFIIVNSVIDLTIYEPQLKRFKFLQEIKNTLNLKVKIKNIRAEQSLEKETFDFVTARAVAPLPVLIEISHKLLKVGGQMFFIKGPKVLQEIKLSKQIMKKLNVKCQIKPLSFMNKTINLAILKKVSKTPSKFPRSWAQIKRAQENTTFKKS